MGRHSRSLSTASVGLALVVVGAGCNESPVEPQDMPATVSATVATATRIDLGTLGGTHSYATDINDLGTVVGWSENAAGISRAFRWTHAQGMTDLGTLPGDDWSRAISISLTGRILGVSGRTGDETGSPVAWSAPGAATPLPIPLLPGAKFMLVADGNAFGQVVGSGLGGTLSSHAWVWSRAAGIYDITATIPADAFESYSSGTNNLGLVVGTNHVRVCVHSPICWHAFVWSARRGYLDIGIPGSDLSTTQVTGSGLNDRGVVVGWTAAGGNSGVQAYRWTNSAGFTLLPTFSPDPNTYGYALSVNLTGTAVGASIDGAIGAIQAAAWPGAGGIVKLSPDDPNSSVAVAVNVVGVVVGWSSLGAAANHATLWRLRPGRGASPPPIASNPPAPVVTKARVVLQGARTGPVGCLSDRGAVLSRQVLINCVVKKGE